MLGAPDEQKRALITGITGQDGSYLAEFLLARGYQVWGLLRRSSSPTTARIDHLLDGERSLRLIDGDLADSSSLARVIEAVRPQEVYNLGAQSHVHVSFQLPVYTGDVTGLGAVRLLEAIRPLGNEVRFYQASSSELYGEAKETPQTEATAFAPRSPYAVAKAYAYYITRNYRDAYGLFAVNGILFNHESPRRGENFVTRKITRGVADIKAGRQEKLRLGNLNASRDWGYAGDYVDAMWRMLQADAPDDYVIATGETHTVREFCELAFARAGLAVEWEGLRLDEKGRGSDGEVLIEVDPDLFRPAEVEFLKGDASKARSELGWRPEVTFEGLVEMMVDADLEASRA